MYPVAIVEETFYATSRRTVRKYEETETGKQNCNEKRNACHSQFPLSYPSEIHLLRMVGTFQLLSGTKSP